jgi:hypothetical protein
MCLAPVMAVDTKYPLWIYRHRRITHDEWKLLLRIFLIEACTPEVKSCDDEQYNDDDRSHDRTRRFFLLYLRCDGGNVLRRHADSIEHSVKDEDSMGEWTTFTP